jgi:hypothetical protein
MDHLDMIIVFFLLGVFKKSTLLRLFASLDMGWVSIIKGPFQRIIQGMLLSPLN